MAEFNGPQGPSLALTEPDNAHEYPEPEKQHQQTAAQTGGKSPSRASSEWELNDRKDSNTNASQQQSTADVSGQQQSDLANVFTQRGCPPHGAKAICGRRPRMEDAYTAVPFLLEVSCLLCHLPVA